MAAELLAIHQRADRADRFELGKPRGDLGTAEVRDMAVRNDLDRYRLVSDVIDRLPQLGTRPAYAKQAIRDKLLEHQQYICEYGDDMPEITGWRWGGQHGPHGARTSTEGDNL